jgi:putative phage-type endonuclease
MRASRVKWLLENFGQNDQRTAAWHMKRGQMLTASEIYKGLADATPAQKHELIMSKLVPRPITTGPGARSLLWGTRFEPIAKQIYCEIQYNIDIADTTCVPHPTVDFLGASPDGIILAKDENDWRHGKLVEFKCPISREFNEHTPIPIGYFHQMQLQMECTGLDECEYIEMAFKHLNYTEWMDSRAPYKSLFAVHNETGDVLYRDYHDTRDPHIWKEQTLQGDVMDYTITYWALQNWRATTVKKQLSWLEQHLPSLSQVWAQVLEHRKNNTFPPNPKELETLVV